MTTEKVPETTLPLPLFLFSITMILYLAKQYIINTLAFFVGLSILPLSFGVESSSVISRALFWGGIFSGIYTYYSLKKRNIWPLYDNLRYPRYLLLIWFFLILQFLNFSIRPFY